MRSVLWLSVLVLVCAACAAGATRTRRYFAAPASERVRAFSSTSNAGQPIDPSAFNPGACIAFSPTASARHLTVFLGAGHVGHDPGAVGITEAGQTINEADEVELSTMAILRAAGFRVVVSRTGDTSVRRLRRGDVSGGTLTVQSSHEDVVARDVCADEADANVLVGSTSTPALRRTPAL